MNVITMTLNPCIDKTLIVKNFAVGETNRVVKMRGDVGGKGINVSRILNGFGMNTVATGIIAGNNGADIEEYMVKLGVKTDFVYGVGETRTNLKIIDSDTNVATEINEPGYPAGEAYGKLRNKLIELLPFADLLVAAGSTPPDLDDTVYMELISLAKAYDVKTILDASGKKLKRGIAAAPFAIKPNKAELEEIVGHKLNSIDEIIKEAKLINESGVERVVVSLGADGAVFVKDDLVLRSKPFPIEVKSAAAAGDSMIGALIYAMEFNFSLIDTAKLMTAAGTITASKEGTLVADLEEVSASYEKVEIEIID